MATAVGRELGGRTPLVGRDTELAALHDLLDELAQAHGRFVLVGGEAGVGKTRVCEEAAARAVERGAIVLFGRCLEGDAPLPYLPFLELIEEAARAVAPDAMRQALGDSASHLAAIAPHLRVLFPDIAPMPPYLPEHERQYVFSALRDFLDRLSRQVPLVVVFEDIHWADESTLLLIRHLVPFVPSRQVLAFATYRPSETQAAASPQTSRSIETLVDQVRRSRAGAVMMLADLDHDDVGAMLSTMAGKPPPDDVTGNLYQLTGGNPFFVEQIVNHLVEEERLFDVRGGWALHTSSEVDVPDTVRAVIDRRLQRTGDACSRVLAVAAAIGGSFDVDLLRRIAATDALRVDGALTEAEAAHLVTCERPGRFARFTFAHDLIRQTLLGRLTLSQRQRLHAEIAMALEALPDASNDERTGEIAYHRARAGDLVDGSGTLHYLQLAAARALSSTAFERASELYGLAAGYAAPDDPALRCDLLLNAAEASKRASDSEAAQTAFGEAAELARAVGDGRMLARAALGYGRSWPTISSVDTRAVALLEDALAALPSDDLAIRGRVYARLALQQLYGGSPRDVIAIAREGVAIARASGDPVTLARALQVLHVALWEPPYLEERLLVATEILECAAAAGDPAVAMMGHRPRIADLAELARMDETEAEIDAYERLATQVRQPIYDWLAAVRRAMFTIFQGRFDEGERLAQRSLELGQRAEGQNLAAAFGGQLLVIRWQQGRQEELRQLVSAARASQPDVKLWIAVMAFLESESGNTIAARAALDQLAEGRFDSLPNEDTRLVVLILATLVCSTLGDGLRSEELYELLLPYDGRNIVVSEGVACVGAAAHYLGLLSATARRWDDAARHFEDSIELNARTGGRPWLAQSQSQLARLLLTRRRPGDRVRARDLLRNALGIARDCGMRRLQESIEGMQRSHRKLEPERPGGLTDREAEVLRLIASGRSTREISERLVLSPRTTARHITNIYAKIGARNRVEATAYARRNGFDA